MNISSDTKFRWLFFSLFLVAIFEVLSFTGWELPRYIALPFFLTIILLIGHSTLREGFEALVQMNFKSINFLMTIAVAGAFYLEKYVEAAIVIVLYNLAEKLEDFGIQKSKQSLSHLAEKMPKMAQVKGYAHPVSVDQVKIGDVLEIKPGEMVPLDGKVLLGFTAVDESTITGEPLAKDKIVGDTVFAGTLNKQGYIEVQVTKLAKETTLAKIQEITSQAFQAKAHTQKFIETFSSYYTPAVILLALFWLLFSTFYFCMPFDQSFQNALALLVIACPCALVISTPVSIYSAIGNAAGRGILIKGGRYLEAIGKIKAIALDKTRTLTYGNPIVSDVIAFGSHSAEHVLSCAAGIEIRSEHPLAKSIVSFAHKKKCTPHAIENFQIKIGRGVQADCLVCEEKHHCVGKLEFLLEEHHVPAEVIEQIDLLQKEGKTVVAICTHKEVEGVVALIDEVRPESKQAIDAIKRLGIVPIMLTGDNATSAHAIAKMVGIHDVRSNLLPEDKAREIEALLAKYSYVAMVGDGVNDAPALALSSVGLTMSDLGSDTAIETASIVILDDYLNKIPFIINLGRKTLRTIGFNIILAVTVKFIFIALALLGLSNLALAIFADVGITVLVIVNSLRLAKELPS